MHSVVAASRGAYLERIDTLIQLLLLHLVLELVRLAHLAALLLQGGGLRLKTLPLNMSKLVGTELFFRNLLDLHIILTPRQRVESVTFTRLVLLGLAHRLQLVASTEPVIFRAIVDTIPYSSVFVAAEDRENCEG